MLKSFTNTCHVFALCSEHVVNAKEIVLCSIINFYLYDSKFNRERNRNGLYTILCVLLIASVL